MRRGLVTGGACCSRRSHRHAMRAPGSSAAQGRRGGKACGSHRGPWIRCRTGATRTSDTRIEHKTAAQTALAVSHETRGTVPCSFMPAHVISPPADAERPCRRGRLRMRRPTDRNNAAAADEGALSMKSLSILHARPSALPGAAPPIPARRVISPVTVKPAAFHSPLLTLRWSPPKPPPSTTMPDLRPDQ